MKSLLFIFLSVFAISSTAQTITKADFLSQVGIDITTQNFSTDEKDSLSNDVIVGALISQSGAGQTWDFNGLTFSATDLLVTHLQAGTSGAIGAEDPKLGIANYVQRTTSPTDPAFRVWNYYTVGDASVLSHGVVTDSLGVVYGKIVYDPPLTTMVFPLSMGTTWDGGTSTEVMEIIPGLSVTIETTNHYAVDGSGTVLLPAGKSFSGLRVAISSYSKIGPFPFPPEYRYDTTTHYSFMSSTPGYSASLSPKKDIPGSGFTLHASASYSIPATGGSVEHPTPMGTGFQLTANPATSETRIIFTSAKAEAVTVSLVDAIGRVHYTTQLAAQVGENVAHLSLTALPAGSYTVQLVTGGQFSTKLLVVSR